MSLPIFSVFFRFLPFFSVFFRFFPFFPCFLSVFFRFFPFSSVCSVSFSEKNGETPFARPLLRNPESKVGKLHRTFLGAGELRHLQPGRVAYAGAAKGSSIAIASADFAKTLLGRNGGASCLCWNQRELNGTRLILVDVSDIFYFFSARGGERGSPRRQGGGGSVFY